MMSQAKRRGAIILAGLLVVAIAEAWVLAPGLAIALAIHLASPIDDDPNVPNSPWKLWLLWAMAGGGLALIVLGLTSKAAYVLIGTVWLAMSLPAIWVIRRGRNPWWLRGWADYRGR